MVRPSSQTADTHVEHTGVSPEHLTFLARQARQAVPLARLFRTLVPFMCGLRQVGAERAALGFVRAVFILRRGRGEVSVRKVDECVQVEGGYEGQVAGKGEVLLRLGSSAATDRKSVV